MGIRPENRIFWPAMAAISLVLAVRNRPPRRLTLPPHIICLLAYLAFAGASVLWAFRPELSFIRFAAASDDCYIHCSACHAGGSNSGYDARPVSMLRVRFDLECLFRTRRTRRSVVTCDMGLSRIFYGQELSGRMCSGRFFAVTSRNALSRPPASVGYHRCRHRHFTPLLKQFQNSVWSCSFCSVAGWTYIDYQKENAHFPGDHYIVHTILLRRIVQRIWLQYESLIIHPIRRFDLHGSYDYMGFRAL